MPWPSRHFFPRQRRINGSDPGLPFQLELLAPTGIAAYALCGLLGRALAAVRALEDFPAVFGALGALSGRPVNSNQSLRSMAAACPPKLPREPSKGTNPDNDLSTRVAAAELTGPSCSAPRASVAYRPTQATRPGRRCWASSDGSVDNIGLAGAGPPHHGIVRADAHAIAENIVAR